MKTFLTFATVCASILFAGTSFAQPTQIFSVSKVSVKSSGIWVTDGGAVEVKIPKVDGDDLVLEGCLKLALFAKANPSVRFARKILNESSGDVECIIQ